MQRSCADMNSPYNRKWWTNSGGPLVNSLLLAPPPPLLSQCPSLSPSTFSCEAKMNSPQVNVIIHSKVRLIATVAEQYPTFQSTPELCPPFSNRTNTLSSVLGRGQKSVCPSAWGSRGECHNASWLGRSPAAAGGCSVRQQGLHNNKKY